MDAAPRFRHAALEHAVDRASCPKTWRWRASAFDAECPGVDLSEVDASLHLYFQCPGHQFYAV